MSVLTKESNLILKDLSPEQRKEKIREWYQTGKISKEQYNALSLKNIKKEINHKHPVPERNRRKHRKNSQEIEMTNLRHCLNARLKNYLATRDERASKLSYYEYQKFKDLITQFPYCWDEVNKLLEIGLRYPEPSLNEFCVKFIESSLKKKSITNHTLWFMLWENGHLVPNDTIRLMLNKEGNIDDYFSPFLIRYLIPLMQIHLEKENLRLREAHSKPTKNATDVAAKEKDIERKTQRVEAFNNLIAKSKAFIGRV